MDERLAKRFKDLCQGRGQPDERDFAAALLAIDADVAKLSVQVSSIETALAGPSGGRRGEPPLLLPAASG